MTGIHTMTVVHVHGLPKGQPRPRAFARGGRARVYDPGTAEGWKSQIAEAIQPYLPTEPWADEVELFCTFYFPRPKTHYLRGELRERVQFFHTGRPDVDNCVKAVMDCLTQVGFWRDDTQVVRLTAEKRYVGNEFQSPGAVITVKRLTGVRN